MKQICSKTKILRYIPLILILLVSAYLRLYRIRDYMTFLGDEGRDVMVVRHMIISLHPTFLGPTASVGGFFLGPLYYYFMTPFLWLFQFDPVGPAVMVALFGIATVLLVYIVSNDFFGKKASIIASAVYALSPLVIAYSRSSWNPNLVPFFALLLIYALYKAVTRNNKLWYVVIGVCYGCGLQLHYLFTFLIPVGAVYLLLYRKAIKHKLRSFVYVVGGWFIFVFPFLGFEIKNHFPNTRSIIQFISAGKEVALGGKTVDNSVVEIVFRLFGRLIFYFPPKEQWFLFNKTIITGWQIVVVLCIVVTIGLLLYQILKKRKKQAILLMLWLVFGVGLFFFYHRAVYDYYLGIVFPLPFLLFGNFMEKAWAGWRKWIVLIFFGSLLVLNWSGRPFKYAPNKQLQQAQNVARFVFDKAEGKPFNFALITGGNSDHAYRYFFELWGNTPVTIENTQNDPSRHTVTDQLLVVCEIGDCKPLGHPLWEIAGFGRAVIEKEWKVGVLQVFKLVHLTDRMVQ